MIVSGASASLGNGGTVLIHTSSTNLMAAVNMFGECLYS